MAKTRKILLLPGDGIGPEVIGEVRKILEWMNKTKSNDFVLFIHSSIFFTSVITSGPIPSPGNSKIFLVLAII